MGLGGAAALGLTAAIVAADAIGETAARTGLGVGLSAATEVPQFAA